MPCEEQDRLLQELRSAVEEHAQWVEKIVTPIRSGLPGERFQDLVHRAAESKGKWETARSELSIHCKQHGCWPASLQFVEEFKLL